MQTFLKLETSTKATDPRNITPRSDAFLSVLGPYVSAIEHEIKKTETKFLVKGLSPRARDSQMKRHLLFDEHLESDYSRFDASISEWMVCELERLIFVQFFPVDEHPILHALLRTLKNIDGTTSLGIKYTVQGTRASGDAHTSIANGFLNAFATYWALNRLPDESWISTHEGDDGLLSYDSYYSDQIRYNVGCISLLGLCMRDVHITNELSDAMFCARLLVPVAGKIRSICDLPRALAKFGFVINNLPPQHAILAKALSYYSTDSNTPIISVYCYKIICLLSHLIPSLEKRLARATSASGIRMFEKRKIMGGLHMAVNVPEPHPEHRAAVAEKWGISIPLQQHVEDMVLKWNFIPNEWPVIMPADDAHCDDARTTYYNWKCLY